MGCPDGVWPVFLRQDTGFVAGHSGLESSVVKLTAGAKARSMEATYGTTKVVPLPSKVSPRQVDVDEGRVLAVQNSRSLP